MQTYDALVFENGQPLTTHKLERGQALYWLPYIGSVADDATLAPVRVTVLGFTDAHIVLRFPDGSTHRRKPTCWNVLFAAWCARCERPAVDAAAGAVCPRCGAACDATPAHVFPAVVRPEDLKVARRYRLMAERGWTHGQAWNYVYTGGSTRWRTTPSAGSTACSWS